MTHLKGEPVQAGPERVFVETGGGKYEIIIHGTPRPGRAAIIFLHEGLGSAGLWRDYPARIAAGAGTRAVAISRLGYGGSGPAALPRPVDYMAREALFVMPGLVSALGLDSYVLYGHSDGGSIALYNAVEKNLPGLLGVVTEAAHVLCEELTMDSIRKARMEYTEGVLRGKLARHHGANVDTAFWGWCDMWLDPAFSAWNFAGLLKPARVPVLSIQGDRDEYGTMAQLDAIKESMGGEVKLIPGAGHAIFRDRPGEAEAAVLPFIKNLVVS